MEQTKSAVNINAWDAIIEASFVVQLTLLILASLSVVCWAITFSKWKQFKKIEEANKPFEEAFRKASSLDEVFDLLSDFANSTLANVFRAGYLEMKNMAGSSLMGTGEANKRKAPLLLSGTDNLKRALDQAIGREISKVELRLSLLATTGSTGPFIGLFGTVWGIMGAFQKIGATNTASLAVVAPGISEALVATAIGLAAAIPATVAYNHYLTQVRKQELVLQDFSADFLNIARRNFFKDS